MCTENKKNSPHTHQEYGIGIRQFHVNDNSKQKFDSSGTPTNDLRPSQNGQREAATKTNWREVINKVTNKNIA
jgi:hypothetical protein